MDKPFGRDKESKEETKDAPAPKEPPRFGSTATFGSAPLAFGSTFGRPASGGSFFNIAPSFGNASAFPSFLKLSSESTKTDPPVTPPKVAEPPPTPTPKAPASLDFFSSTTTSITFNMPEFKWNTPASAQHTTVAPSAALFGVNPEKPSTNQENEDDEEGDGSEDEQPHSPPMSAVTTLTKPTEPIVTGEEDEVHVHQVKAKLYRLDKDEVRTFWKEKGVGQVRINSSRENPQYCRIVMRMDGALKLILNSKIFPTMPARLVGENSVTLSAMSDEGTGKAEMTSFLLKLQGRTEAELLLAAIDEWKLKAAETPASRGVKRSTTKETAEEKVEKDDGATSAANKEKEQEVSNWSQSEKPDAAPKKMRRRSDNLDKIAKEKEDKEGNSNSSDAKEGGRE